MMWMLPHRAIYMDGRPRPSPTRSTRWQGFSTGEWEGDMLKVTTTHLKEGWLRRNGVPRSDKATLVEYFIRHGDYLTLVTVVKDPVYLTEPFVRTSNWVADPGFQLSPFSCIPTRRDRAGARRGAAPPARRRTDISTSSPAKHGLPYERRARRRRDDVSGLSARSCAPAAASDATRRMRVAVGAAAVLALAARCRRCIARRSDLEVLPGAGQRLRARRAGRQHHRADRPRRAAASSIRSRRR